MFNRYYSTVSRLFFWFLLVLPAAVSSEDLAQATDSVALKIDLPKEITEQSQQSGQTLSTVSAKRILEESDIARGGNVEGLIFQALLISYRGEKEDKRYSMQVESDGDNNLVSFLEPARSRGLRILMRSRNMWFLSPSTSQPVPISPRQRLLGEASNGDIATTNFSRDYDAEIIGEELVDGEPCYVLLLRAKGSNVTYDSIRYYITKQDKLGIKAEYLTTSGKLIKTALMRYENILQVDGRQLNFVSEMRVLNGIDKSRSTIMKYFDVKAQEIPASRFDQRMLMRG